MLPRLARSTAWPPMGDALIEPPLDPCPWFEDGECDEPINGSGICGDDLDRADCCPSFCE